MSGAIALGLLAALLYGATDFVARFAGRAVGTLRTICYGHGLASMLLGVVVLRAGLPQAPPTIWLIMALSNLLERDRL